MENNLKNKTLQYGVIVVLSYITSYCYFVLLQNATFSVGVALIFSVFIALFTNIISFVSTKYGLGYFNKIPKVNLPVTKHERANAFIVFWITFICLVFIHCLMIGLGYRYMIYVTDITFNFVTLFLPIFTTLVSFVLGLLSAKEFTVLEEKREKLTHEYERLQYKWNYDRHRLLNDMKQAIEYENDKYQKESEEIKHQRKMSLRTIFHLIQEIETVGGFTGFEEAIRQKIQGNDTLYNELIRILAEKVKTEVAPSIYSSHLLWLQQGFTEVANEIFLAFTDNDSYITDTKQICLTDLAKRIDFLSIPTIEVK